ncbi:hypothetical protein EK904_007461 [Melospiza melodia maxima]|nr:hypothetical protein EK904_007461 [Melospiza melodia maxima]
MRAAQNSQQPGKESHSRAGLSSVTRGGCTTHCPPREGEGKASSYFPQPLPRGELAVDATVDFRLASKPLLGFCCFDSSAKKFFFRSSSSFCREDTQCKLQDRNKKVCFSQPPLSQLILSGDKVQLEHSKAVELKPLKGFKFIFYLHGLLEPAGTIYPSLLIFDIRERSKTYVFSSPHILFKHGKRTKSEYPSSGFPEPTASLTAHQVAFPVAIAGMLFQTPEWRAVKAEIFLYHNLQEKLTSQVLKGTCLSVECDNLSVPEKESAVRKLLWWTPQLFYSSTKNLLETTRPPGFICCLHALTHLCRAAAETLLRPSPYGSSPPGGAYCAFLQLPSPSGPLQLSRGPKFKVFHFKKQSLKHILTFISNKIFIQADIHRGGFSTVSKVIYRCVSIKCLIICGSMLIDVYNHTSFAFPTEKWLKQTSQLTLSEWNVAWLHPQGGKKIKIKLWEKKYIGRRPVGCSYLSLSGSEDKTEALYKVYCSDSYTKKCWYFTAKYLFLLSTNTTSYGELCSLSPKTCVLLHLSEPAKSQKDNLRERVIQNTHMKSFPAHLRALCLAIELFAAKLRPLNCGTTGSEDKAASPKPEKSRHLSEHTKCAVTNVWPMKSSLVPGQKDRLAQLAPWPFSSNCCPPAAEIPLCQPGTSVLLTRTYHLVLHGLTLPPPPHNVRQDTFSSIYTLLTELLQQNLRVGDRKTLLCLSLLSFQSVYVLITFAMHSFSSKKKKQNKPVFYDFLFLFTKEKEKYHIKPTNCLGEKHQKKKDSARLQQSVFYEPLTKSEQGFSHPKELERFPPGGTAKVKYRKEHEDTKNKWEQELTLFANNRS